MKRNAIVAICFACLSGVVALVVAHIWQGRGNAYRLIENHEAFFSPSAAIDMQIHQKLDDIRWDCMICQTLTTVDSVTNADASAIRTSVLDNVRKLQMLRQLKHLTDIDSVRRAADSAGYLYIDEKVGVCYRVEDFVRRWQERSVAGWAKRLCLAWMLVNGMFVAFLFRREVFAGW